jgi:glycosyltransferase involved in cell wall biosynthesis
VSEAVSEAAGEARRQRPVAVPAAPAVPGTSLAAGGPTPGPVEAAPEVTVLVPVYDEADSVAELAARVTAVFDALGRSFEIVFVDDGSRDGTRRAGARGPRHDPRVKLVRLRRNFGKAAALCAGLDHSRGELVVTMDGDLQDDPEEIPRFLARLEEEELDLVSGWKRRRHGPGVEALPLAALQLGDATAGEVDLHDFNCGFKLYRREVLEQIAIYGELHRYIPVLASRRGFRSARSRCATTRAGTAARSTAGTGSTRGCST